MSLEAAVSLPAEGGGRGRPPRLGSVRMKGPVTSGRHGACAPGCGASGAVKSDPGFQAPPSVRWHLCSCALSGVCWKQSPPLGNLGFLAHPRCPTRAWTDREGLWTPFLCHLLSSISLDVCCWCTTRCFSKVQRCHRN